MAKSDRDRAIPGMPDAENRAENDFYRTPRYATDMLLKVEQFYGTVWEPACGDGAISEVLLENGLTVLSTDLIDRGYGQGTLNFLTAPPPVKIDCLITNPPFKFAYEFAQRAVEVTDGKVALLCRLLWLSSQKRRKFFINSPLARVWIFSKRLNFNRDDDPRFESGKGGMVDYVWAVWDKKHVGPTNLMWFPDGSI